MDKYTIITMIAIIAIVIPFATSAINIIGAEQLQYRWDSPGMFSFFKLTTDGKLEFCNTMPFWTSFEKFKATMYYQGEIVGVYTIESFIVNPSSTSVQNGVFTSEHISRAHSMAMTIDHGISGGEFRMDERQLTIQTVISTPILGLIPYDVTTQMSGLEFNEKMNTANLSCS